MEPFSCNSTKTYRATVLTHMATLVSFGAQESTKKCEKCAKNNNNAKKYNRAFAACSLGPNEYPNGISH